MQAIQENLCDSKSLMKSVALQSASLFHDDIHVRTVFPARDIDVLVDKFQIQLAALNIIRNAHYELLKVKKRILEIRCSVQRKRAIIEFQDSGNGIPRDCFEKIFSPFFTTKPEGEGTGLGLVVARAIVEAHGGRLWAKSGRGATFVLELPLDN